MTVGLIVACSVNGVIGEDGKIPWHFPGDFKRFKELTSGGVVIMGRKTWESLPKKPLPKRLNIVVTSMSPMEFKEKYPMPDVWAKPSIEEALQMAEFLEPDRDVWFIGGSRIYKECVPFCDIMDFTYVPYVLTPHDHMHEFAYVNEMGMVGQDWVAPDGVQQHPYEETLTFKRYVRR